MHHPPASSYFLAMAPKCEASMVEPYYHAAALLQLVDKRPNIAVYRMFSPKPRQVMPKLTIRFADYFAKDVSEVVELALRGSRCQRSIPHPEEFRAFVTRFFTCASPIEMPVVLIAIVLMHRVDKDRMRAVMESTLETRPCRLIFLASLCVALKVRTVLFFISLLQMLTEPLRL